MSKLLILEPPGNTTKNGTAHVSPVIFRLDWNEKYRKLLLHECSSSSPVQLVRSFSLITFGPIPGRSLSLISIWACFPSNSCVSPSLSSPALLSLSSSLTAVDWSGLIRSLLSVRVTRNSSQSSGIKNGNKHTKQPCIFYEKIDWFIL